jgi:hypothetical protein
LPPAGGCALTSIPEFLSEDDQQAELLFRPGVPTDLLLRTGTQQLDPTLLPHPRKSPSSDFSAASEAARGQENRRPIKPATALASPPPF